MWLFLKVRNNKFILVYSKFLLNRKIGKRFLGKCHQLIASINCCLCGASERKIKLLRRDFFV